MRSSCFCKGPDKNGAQRCTLSQCGLIYSIYRHRHDTFPAMASRLSEMFVYKEDTLHSIRHYYNNRTRWNFWLFLLLCALVSCNLFMLLCKFTWVFSPILHAACLPFSMTTMTTLEKMFSIKLSFCI